MRFYSHKRGSNRINGDYKAENAKTRFFVVPNSSIKGFIFLIILALFFTIVFPHVQAQSEGLYRPKVESIIVFPSQISADTVWQNIETLNSQDLSESSLFQDFNKSNSTYLDFNADDNSFENNSNEVEVLNTSDSEGISESEDVVNEVSEPTEDAPLETVIEDPVLEPEINEVETVSEPVSLKSDGASSLVSIFKRVIGTFALAQADIVETIPVRESESDAQVQSSEDTLGTEADLENNLEPVVESDVIDLDSDASESEVDIETPSGSEEVGSASNVRDEDTRDRESSFEFTLSDFGIPELESGQFIDNLQLRLSLAGQYDTGVASSPAFVTVSYSFGEFSRDAGSIMLDEEISNALNGGYFLIPLPSITDPALLTDLNVTISIDGDVSNLDSLYIDSAWLDVGTVVFDKELLDERFSSTEMLKHLEGLTHMSLVSDRLDFLRHEVPQFNIRYESQRNFIVRILRDLFGKDLITVDSVAFVHNEGEPINVSPELTVTKEGLISVSLPEDELDELIPGTYTLEFTIDEGGYTTTDSLQFQWGLLSINSNQTTYETNTPATIAMGALSPSGNTICDARLNLYIADPVGFISSAPVVSSGQCNGNNVVDVPDYSSQFVTGVPGEYTMYLERVDESGNVISHTRDTFLVVENQPLALERNGPTRIYPVSPYAMELTVRARTEDFTGKLVERVPSNFTIFNTDAEIRSYEEYSELVWDMSLQSGESVTVSYEFDAPDISPYLYTLGPAKLVSDQKVSRDSVQREVQDEIVDDFVLPDTEASTQGESTNVPAEITVPESLESILLQSEPRTEEALPSDDLIPVTLEESVVAPIDTPLEIDQSIEESLSYVSVFKKAVGEFLFAQADRVDPIELDEEGASVTEADAVAETTPQVIEEEIFETAPETQEQENILFEEHRQWQIASDATGSMILFWTSGASIPSGWTCISCISTDIFYQRFPLGSSVYGTTGGVPTTTHTASGSVAGATGANTESNAGSTVSVESHSHTITPVIGSTSTLPAFRQLRVIQSNNSGDPGTIPAGAVLIFDGTLPSGWAEYSPINGRYPYGQNTITSGGSNVHTHSVTGTTSSAGGSTITARTTGGTVAASPPAHTHSISSTTALINQEPPYIEVIFATSSVATTTPLNAIAMWSDTPPAGWLDRSSDATKPFYNRYIKGASTYGTTGGSESHSHVNMSITSSAPIGTALRRNGGVGANGTHTHVVSVTDFTSASNTPPYVTVIFGKFFGYVPIFDQINYEWFANTNAITPTDPWPAGAENIDETTPIDASLIPVKNGDVLRLRMGVNVSNSTTTGESFKLQFGTTTELCTAVPSWTDVGAATSSAKWVGYNNASVADGATLSSSTLTGTNVFASYEEQNPSVVLPNQIGIGQNGEWDFVLEHNGADAGTIYCFRMVKSDGTEFFTYTNYPSLVTNQHPDAPALSKPFDNEKVASTTPLFEFTSVDSEANDITYQIQIDNNYTFSSIEIDQNSTDNGDQFLNLNTPEDKDPYTNGNTMQFTPPSALTNGTTYYYRVRGQDPTGSNEWSDWSSVYSFTVDITVPVSTWFQTTQEQFDTNTLEGTDATVANLVQLATGSTTGTTTSSAIDFLDGTLGNAWGSFTWTHNETFGDLKYRVQYYNETTSSWDFIPNATLPGNSAGFDVGPVSLLTLDVKTYRRIRLLAIFTNSGGSPTLSDWTVSWGYRIETPTLNAPFPSEKVGTTSPTFEFYTTDPQSDSLIYEIQWSTSFAFTASTTRVSNTHAGFTNIEDGLDSSPFTSGDTIQFKIQPSDALTNNTTYWWRVRARDPLGGNEYSFYTDPQSLTVDTTVTVSTWFQTTQDQFNTDILEGTVTQASNAVTVATTTRESLVAYAEGVETAPRYRIWDGTAWGSELNALTVGASINWIVTRAAPLRNEYIAATLGTDADVNVQVYRNGSWGDLQEITTSVSNTNMRGLDVAYETLSGTAMVVTCDGDSNPTYYTWNGSSWTNGGSIGLTAGNTCGWVKLISDPISNEIIAVVRDTGGLSYEARVWSGSSWGNSVTWGSMQASQVNHEGIAAEYEESGNQAVVAVSNGTASSFSWRSWDGASWTAAATVALGDDFESGTIVADDGTDTMALCYHDEDGDLGAVRWTGSAWTGLTELETLWTNLTAQFNDRPIDCAYEVGGARDGFIMVVYSDTTNLRYRSWNGATWVAEASISTIQDATRVQVRRTQDNLIQALVYDHTNDRYDYSFWNGTSWSAIQTLEANGSPGASPYLEPFMIAAKNPATSGTVVGDPGIDFYAGSGPFFQSMSWTDTESGGSSILYQVEYYDGTSWELIPNSLIPGNSTGTGTSPINLTNVLPVSTYNTIRGVANLSCNLGTCPILSDWTITWSEGITISGSAREYDQSTNVTSGTVAVAVNGVVQIGKTGTISAGAWSISNVNVVPGDIVTVFVNGGNTADEAVGVTRYDGVGNISGMQLFKKHLALGSNDATTTPFTNTDIGLYDFTNTEDVFFDVSGGALNLCADAGCGDARLYVGTGFTYRPRGAVITHDFFNYGTFSLEGNTMQLSGSWRNLGTTTAGTSTIAFTATSSVESIDETGVQSADFYNVTFGTTTGTATWNLVTALTIDNDLTVSRGTLNRGVLPITLEGNLVTGANGFWSGMGTTTFSGAVARTWSDANSVLQNVGRVVIDGGTKRVTLAGNVLAESIFIGADDILDASTSNYAITVLSNWINLNSFVARSGEVIMAATTTNRSITVGSSSFYNLTFNGVLGAWSFTGTNLTVTNNFRVATGTVTMPTGTTTVSGSWNSVGGTFAHNNALVYFTSSAAATIAASGTAFTNNFYNLRFTGSGSFTFLDTNATTSEDIRITQGTVTFPSNTLSVGGNFLNSGGTFAHNNGTVRFTSTGAELIDTNASFNSLAFTGSGSWSFFDSSVTLLGSLSTSAGTVTLPSGTLTVGGSVTNTATIAHNSGTVLFNSLDGGETISLGNSPLYNMTFNSLTGGWTVASHATTTNNFTLATTSTFTLASGQTLAVGGTFANDTRNSSTTWTGSTLSLEAGNYTINTKNNSGDTYATLRIKANTDIKMWNSSASTYTVDATGSLYSQDHSAIDGDLNIYGSYERTSGTEFWSYTTDFDGAVLSTSTARQVDVRFASGASGNISQSIIDITGSTTGTTTVDNQGSGNYTVTITGGTTTARYYSFRNLGATGVSLLAANKVTSLRNGAISPGVGGGTGFTISSTTIDANPQLQIYQVDFSTTSSIVANNIKQIDGTPASYWWFRESTGGLDGETNDLDTGDPGSIRWDDSSLVITVSGTVYSDDGVTPMGNPTCDNTTQNIRIVVQGGASYTGSCASANGTYSIPGVVVVGDPVITVYLNTNGGTRGTVVTRTPTADITDLDIYQNRVITRHEDVEAMTILKMAVFDRDNDSDIQFTAATGTLTVFANTELHVASSTTFAPGGDITIHANASNTSFDGSLHIDNNAIFLGTGTSTYTLGGSFTMDDGATFTSASTTVVMNATTTGKTITTGSTQEITFTTLEFNGLGGGWNINGDIRALLDIDVSTGTVSGTGDITVVGGSLSGNGLLSMGGGTTTLHVTNTLGGTTPWTFANLVLGNGSVVGTTTPGSNATTTILEKLTISTAHFLDAGGSYWNLAGSGNVFVESGTLLEDTSTFRYSGVGGTNILSTTYYNLDLKAQGGAPTYIGTGLGILVMNDLTVGGASPTTFTLDTNDPVLDVNGSVRIDSTGTLIQSGSALTTVGGSWDNNGTYTASGGTLTFDGGGAVTISAGNSSFANVNINGAGSFVVSEHATGTGAFTLSASSAFTLSSGQVLAVGGTFTNNIGSVTTWTGSSLYLYGGGNYQINASTTSDTYDVLRIGSGTQIRMWNSSAGTYDISPTASLYSQDHANVTGDLYIYGMYTKTSGTDYWSYGTDFDGTLISGSPRVADIYIQSGSSILYSGGGLSVLGTLGNETVIQNQGSGTYSFRIGGSASTTWSYYDLEDMNSAGLTFSGTPNVVTLSYGNITVSENAGSGMTVGGTVITQNPAKTFTENIFATTTAISAFNVTATGTSISSWRFTNHTGNLSGEAFDVDPDGNPGYLVWDDSAASITISGNVYSDEGTTVSTVCNSSSNRIRLIVGGIASTTVTSCNGDGAGGGTGYYQFSNIQYSAGDSVIVYIDGVAAQGATVTEDPVSNIAGLHIYENRVIARHEGTEPLTIADMSLWDSSDDADIPFTAVDSSPDTLTLTANKKLIIWTGKEFEPNGNVTVPGGGGGSAFDGTLELYTNAFFDATGSETHTIGGSLISGSGADIDDDTSTFIFTTTGAGRTIDTNNDSFYNLTLNGSGSWTVTNTTLDIGNDFLVTQGAVMLPSATTTVTGSLTVAGGSFDASGGTMVFNSGSAEIIRPRTSSFGTLIINGLGSFSIQGGFATTTGDVRILDGSFTSATGTLAVGGSFINGDTFLHGSGVLRFTSAGTALVTARGADLFTTQFVGGGTYTFTDASVALLGSMSIGSGAVTLATGTTAIGGSFTNTGGTFNNASGTILFNSADTGETINPGSSPFHTVTVASAGGGWTLSNSATTTGSFSLTSATSFTVSPSTVLTVGGVFTNLVGGGATTWTGSTLVINSGSTYTINTKLAGGDTYENISIGSSTALRVWDSAGTVTMRDGVSSLYSQDHGGMSGSLYIFGNYLRTTGADYWSYATDFDGAALGGGSRQVSVYMASGATTTFTGGALNIVGTNSFDTLVTNQGSGTYALSIEGGTFNALYYSFANMNADGLKLSGLTTVSSLTEGNFTLAVNGGSLITLSSTTLNFNAGFLSTGNSFATTSAITGTNIELVGTTPSAWTFTSHTGNLDGENYDSDGIDACGSIRWDDSGCVLIEQSAYRFRNDNGGEGVPNSEWYDLDWTKRTRVTVTNADPRTYTDAVVKVTVPYDSDMQADFEDLRFTSSDGLTLVSHFTESYTASSEAVVWVKVPVLATSSRAELYMYYGEGTVSDASATTTFIAMDNYEDGNITEYSGDTGEFTVLSGSAYERTYRLRASDPTNGKTDFGGMYNNAMVVSQGQTLRVLKYIDTTSGSGDEVCTAFGTQSQTQNYAVCLELFGVDRMSLARNVLHRDTSGTVLASTTVTYSTGWYEVEIDWNTNNSIFVTLLKDDVVVATTTATDSNYTSGGMGYTLWGYHGAWDVYSSRPLLTTEPSVTLGGEQVSGGASWRAALNTAVNGISIGENTRVRFLVENGGTPVTAQNYEIEFAAKGNAPSCESVDYNDYVEVPPSASCGTSDICMESSTVVTNLESTTDLLGGEGVFVSGQVVEDPSNNTGNLDVDSGEYTELEYVITPTLNVTDSNYCFRVTNEGAELDAYTKVAEIGLIFAPTISSLSLNAGRDITLVGGATTTVVATGTVSDLNGYIDIAGASTTIFRSGVGESCSLDNNNCYLSGNSLCSLTNCSGNTCAVECTADIYYHAEPTDIGVYAGETWRALLAVNDVGGSVATATAPSIDLITLRAIDVENAINYGALEVNADTGSFNASTTVENIGNSLIDLDVEGTDLTDGGSSAIPVSGQKFATSTFTYSACTVCSILDSTPVPINIDLVKPVATSPAVIDEIYWGIAIPFGVAGTPHQGSVTFTPLANTP